ncbi:MAG: hypothetical protein ACI8Q1_000617 [Parvicella sp.]|jgi:hypothetical protein
METNNLNNNESCEEQYRIREELVKKYFLNKVSKLKKSSSNGMERHYGAIIKLKEEKWN